MVGNLWVRRDMDPWVLMQLEVIFLDDHYGIYLTLRGKESMAVFGSPQLKEEG